MLQVSHVNLLYHEATFTDKHAKRAKETFHSTAAQAALVAKTANVTKLIIGHFSARYPSEDILVNEASAVFENVVAAHDGMVLDVPV
jgi:ribonuclease Z